MNDNYVYSLNVIIKIQTYLKFNIGKIYCQVLLFIQKYDELISLKCQSRCNLKLTVYLRHSTRVKHVDRIYQLGVEN